MRCTHCSNPNTRFLRRMTNVDKYFCRVCRKPFYIPISDSIADDCSSPPPPPGKTGFMLFDHQGKEKKFLEALNHGGKYLRMDCARRYKGVKFCLTDSDILGRRFKLDHMRRSGVKHFFVYPHAARPNIVNDIHPEWAHTTAQFVVSRGHAEVMEAYGYSRPLVPVGWSLCPIRPFKPRPAPRNVLFAPIHPRCSEIDQKVNRAAFERLEKLARRDEIHLTVRFIRSLPESGLQRVEHPNITWSVGYMDQGYEQIDNADVVIAHQTYMYLAVARGVPAIGLAEGMATHIQLRNKPVLWANNWNAYEHLLRFPYDILEADNPLGMLERAVACDAEIADWRRRMIGSPFDKKAFVTKLEKFL